MSIKAYFYKFLQRTVGSIFPNLGQPLGKIGNGLRCHYCRMIGSSVEKGAIINKKAQIQRNCVLKKGSSVGENCLVQEGTVFLGRCLMGPGVHIYTINHHYDADLGTFKGYETRSVVEIGDEVWIGHNAILLPGSKIGSHCIVGAGAVVTKDFSNTCGVLIAGVPAEIKKNNRSTLL